MNNKENLSEIRHSAAHVLAQATLELFPGTLPTIGPVTETGFFYDFLPVTNFKEDDLPRIEEKMREIVKKNYPITGKQVSKDEGRAFYKDNKFKLELIEGIDAPTVGLYSQGSFTDLCRGGHTATTGDVKFFKLMNISGSYWRADRSGQALQRITGICFETQKELDDYLQKIEDAKVNDHRRLGKILDLFSFHEEAPGSVFFHPKGTLVFNKMIEYSRSMQNEDYQEIKTPIIMHESIWKTSGHYDYYKENMFFTTIDETTYCVRPMNCPSAIMLYQEKPHSYREFPLRLSEYGLDHRYELSGVLHGLFRVRSFTQDDAHIFCTLEHLENEVEKVLDIGKKIYNRYGFTDIMYYVSTRPAKSTGSQDLWDKGVQALKNTLTNKGIPFEVKEGEGAFYGPKIELHVKDTLGRSWQCGTVQIDFVLPERFNLEYIDADQSRKTPIIIHRAIYGSIERFLGITLENTRGHLPFWLAPVQMRILTITDAQKEYATSLLVEFRKAGFRVELDHSGDQISGQIRQAQNEKIPWMLVIGKKEVENKTITLRKSDGTQEFGLTFVSLVAKAQELENK